MKLAWDGEALVAEDARFEPRELAELWAFVRERFPRGPKRTETEADRAMRLYGAALLLEPTPRMALRRAADGMKRPTSEIEAVLIAQGIAFPPLGSERTGIEDPAERAAFLYRRRMERKPDSTDAVRAVAGAMRLSRPETRAILREQGLDVPDPRRPEKKPKPPREAKPRVAKRGKAIVLANRAQVAAPKPLREIDRKAPRTTPYSDQRPTTLGGDPAWFSNRDLTKARFMSAAEILRERTCPRSETVER